MRLAGGAGADVAYDAVGNDTFGGSPAALGVRGHLVSFGQASGPVGNWDIGRFSSKSVTISRPNYAHYTDTPQKLAPQLNRFFAALRLGVIKVEPPRPYDLAAASQAHRDLESRRTTGALGCEFGWAKFRIPTQWICRRDSIAWDRSGRLQHRGLAWRDRGHPERPDRGSVFTGFDPAQDVLPGDFAANGSPGLAGAWQSVAGRFEGELTGQPDRFYRAGSRRQDGCRRDARLRYVLLRDRLRFPCDVGHISAAFSCPRNSHRAWRKAELA